MTGSASGKRVYAATLHVGAAVFILLGLLLLAMAGSASSLFEAVFYLLFASLPFAAGVVLIRVGSRVAPKATTVVRPVAAAEGEEHRINVRARVDVRTRGERAGKAIVVAAGWLLALVAVILPSCVGMVGVVATFGVHGLGETMGAITNQGWWSALVLGLLVAIAFGVYLMIASRQERLGRVPTDRTQCPYCSAKLTYYGALCPSCKRVLPQPKGESTST